MDVKIKSETLNHIIPAPGFIYRRKNLEANYTSEEILIMMEFTFSCSADGMVYIIYVGWY